MGERLSDRIAIGLLTTTFPPELVDRVVAEAGRTQQRSRLLPARVVVYYVLAMCLFFGQGYEEVARLLTEGLGWARGWRGSWQVPTTAAITRARVRLGRAENPSRPTRHGPTIADPCRGRAGDLRLPPRALRHTQPDAPRRHRRRHRPRPGVLHPHPASRAPPGHRPGGVFPPHN